MRIRARVRMSTGVIGAVVVAATVVAQPPREGPGGRERREGSEGPGRMFRMPPMPLMTALDKDGDGEISTAEIENAVAALKTLDKNQDGKYRRCIRWYRTTLQRRTLSDHRMATPYSGEFTCLLSG